MWFDPAQLMQNADTPSATLATSATFTHSPTVNDGKVARVAKVATPQEVKTANPNPVEVACSPQATHAEILEQQLNSSDKRIKMMAAQLESDPGLRVCVETHVPPEGAPDNAEPEAVILTLAIRDKGACELRIPKSRYDGIALLELIEKHTTRETLQ
jgi:hypothetical protein